MIHRFACERRESVDTESFKDVPDLRVVDFIQDRKIDIYTHTLLLTQYYNVDDYRGEHEHRGDTDEIKDHCRQCGGEKDRHKDPDGRRRYPILCFNQDPSHDKKHEDSEEQDSERVDERGERILSRVIVEIGRVESRH
jgi:hypothetical protein